MNPTHFAEIPVHDMSFDQKTPQARAETLAALLSKAGEDMDANAHIPDEIFDALHASGLPMGPFPKIDGGQDLLAPGRAAELFAVLRLLGSGDLSVGRIYEGHVNAIALVCRYGSENQIRILADNVRAGALCAVWGVDDEAAPVRAERSGQGLMLQGCKILASGAGRVTHPIVPVAAPDGTRLVMPVLRTGERVNLERWTPCGMRASATGHVDMSGLFVPEARLVGEPGDFTRQPAFSGGAWRFCAVQLGGAERLLDLFRQHLVARRRDADPFQLERIALAGAALGSAAFWIAEAARQLADDVKPSEQIVTFANLTRLVTERAILDSLDLVHRGAGLASLMRPHPMERLGRDLATYLRQPLPDLAMVEAARFILSSPRPSGDLWA